MGQSSLTIPELKIKDQQEQQETYMHNNTLVSPASSISIVGINIYCDTFT